MAVPRDRDRRLNARVLQLDLRAFVLFSSKYGGDRDIDSMRSPFELDARDRALELAATSC
jgi:hypothetical protein